MVGLLLLGAFAGLLGATTAIYFGAGVFGAFMAYSGAGFLGVCLAAVPAALREDRVDDVVTDLPEQPDRSSSEKHADTMAQWEDDPETPEPPAESDTRAA